MYIIVFIVTFLVSAFIRIQFLGGSPAKLLAVDWDESMGTIYSDLNYENEHNHKYDLYIPSGLNKSEEQFLIVYIHGGSFNSGKKEDGDGWCKYFATKGYITATIDYTLQTHGEEATIQLINCEIEQATAAMKDKLKELGYQVNAMATSGVSAGGTLAMNLAYNGRSAIPVKFVFQMSGPTYFEPKDWGLLMKVDHLKTKEEFVEMMTGYKGDITTEECKDAINQISPASLEGKNPVPTLIGYGLIDHCVPQNQKFLLMDEFEKYDVPYDYIAFPKSNHGMYNDLDKLQEFLDKSLEYARVYFTVRPSSSC